MKKNLFVAAMALLIMSCAKDPLADSRISPAGGHLCFTLVDADNVSTKSYLADGTTWAYNWETDDEIYFVSKRNGAVHQSGICKVTKSVDQTFIDINAPYPFQKGDEVYAYYSPACGPTTKSTTVKLSIPQDQYTRIGKEKYVTTVTTTGDAETFALNINGNLSSTSTENSSSKTPASKSLNLSIEGYNSSLKYTYSEDGRVWNKLNVANDGTASITVTFPQMSFGGNSTSSTCSRTVSFKCNEGKAATITVKAKGSKAKTSASAKYSYTYSVESKTAGSYVAAIEKTEEVVSYSEDKKIDAEDAMPLVAGCITVTEEMALGEARIGTAMYFKMLGSALELRVFSQDKSIGVGEKIRTVGFKADNTNISGEFLYNMVYNMLTISSLESDSVTAHLEDCSFSVPDTKSEYLPVYMIVAPGTYTATLTITTDGYIYTVPFSSKTYTRASKKAIEIDLSASNVKRVKIGEPEGPVVDPEEPEVPEEPEEPEEPIVDPVPSWETAYAVFASDRHANTNAIYQACHNMDVTDPYVCLVGDMVGQYTKTDSPLYYSSTVKAEVDAVFTNATTQIVWGLHDAGVNDDAGIVKCAKANSSGLIYTGKDSKGNVQYYVYAIAYNDIADNTVTAEAAAGNFEKWVGTITDTTIPVFVVSHVPMHYKRNDNYGAYYWNRAVTYAATGSETGGVSSIKRDVVFIHGHNHTAEPEEVYYSVGTSVRIAKKPSSKKENSYVTCTIPYTYLTGGYLKESPEAGLVVINENDIVFSRYGENSVKSLGNVTRIGSAK